MGGKPQTYSVGMQTFGVWDAGKSERFDVAVFYPASAQERALVRDGWQLQVYEGARITPGFYPVVLLSHDTASSRFANSDVSSTLAASGCIVIVPTHSSDNQNDSDGLYTAKLLATRPQELLLALETVLADARFAPYADESRIGLLGVGFGAVSVMQLVGARPEPSVVDEYCGYQNSGFTAKEDPFCSSWVSGRLADAARDMAGMEKKGETGVFTPSLTRFAPTLEAAPIVVAAPAKPQPEKRQEEGEERSFWQRLFGSGGETKSEEEEKARSANATELPAASANSADMPGLALDFDGGPLFGNTDSGLPYVYLALPDSPQFRVAVSDDAAVELGSPLAQPAQPQKAPVYRRPATVRRIQGIALMTPAGGMLFPRESLAGIRVPALIVEAGADELYAPDRHGGPYLSLLPSRPQVLSLPGVDHFSLFASCSREVEEKLYDTCGRLENEEREEAHRRRDGALVSFFRSVLGVPELPPPPSGFVARPDSTP